MKNFLSILLLLFVSALFFNVQAQDSRVERNKIINITVKGIPSEDAGILSGPYSVDGSGTIKMPYLESSLRVAGKTGRQVEDLLAAEYKKHQIYTNPVFVVTVTTEDLAPTTQFVQVSGNVGTKRSVPYRQGLTLLAAILDAGDITDFGSRHIQVTRKGKTETYDYFSNRDRNMPIMPNDSIYVPQRGILETRPSKLLP